jgi:hypothetical protein
MRIFLVILSLLLSATPPATAQQPGGVIGTIMEVEGPVTITAPGAAGVPAKVSSEIHEKDTVSTGAGARAFILFIDDTEFTLSENSRFSAAEFSFDDTDASANRARYSVTGAFRYLSGLIAKKPDPDVQIETTFGSIGIRGTEIWAGDTEDGYGIHVDEGAIDVRNEAGEVAVGHGFGTVLRSRREMPGRAGQWSPEKIQRIRAKAALKHEGEMRQRIAQHRARQQELRAKYRDVMKERRAKLKEKLEERREQLQDKRGDMKQNLQDQQQRQQNIQQLQQNRQQRLQRLRQQQR